MHKLIATLRHPFNKTYCLLFLNKEVIFKRQLIVMFNYTQNVFGT